MSEVAIALGVSKEVWDAIPDEYKQKITKAVVEGQINLAKQILATGLRTVGIGNPTKELPSELKLTKELISEAEWNNFLSSGFSLETFTQKAELRGLIGREHWTDEMLRMPLARYKQHVVAEGISEDKADLPIQDMAKRLNLDLNHLRRLYYGIEKIKGKLVETPKPEGKKEPTEKEEIVLKGTEE
jgi:hypothetical protein